jgi:hypothetical protein
MKSRKKRIVRVACYLYSLLDTMVGRDNNEKCSIMKEHIMKLVALSVAVLLLACIASPVHAQGTVQFAKKYPKTDPKTNQIVIKGEIRLDKGWKVVGNSVLAHAWEEGFQVKKFMVPLNNDGKSWGETKLVLPPGVTYSVLVSVRVTDGKSWETLAVIVNDVKPGKTK